MSQWVLGGVLGVLFALGTFLVLRRDVVRVVWGVSIISQSANVYLVTMGGLAGVAPIGHFGEEGANAPTDPLVQALVLTAIVIGFGTTALALVLTYRVYQEHGTIDVYNLGLGRTNGVDADGVVADGGADAAPGPGSESEAEPGSGSGRGSDPDPGAGREGGER